MKLSELEREQRQHHLDYIDQRWKQLHTLEIKHSDAATNYLLLVSGGSSAAVLAFIGNLAKDQAVPQSAVCMLGCFALAMLLVGLLKGLITMRITKIFKSWRSLVNQYYVDEISWNEMLDEDNKVVREQDWLPVVLGWTAFGFLCLGVFIGFSKLQEEVNRVRLEETVAATTTKNPGIGAEERAGSDQTRLNSEPNNRRGSPGGAATATLAQKE